MIKSIVVALDGSPSSLAALAEAVSWAERLQAELRGVFVEDEQRFSYYPVGASVEEEVPVPVPLPEDELAQVNEAVRAEGAELANAFEDAVKGKSFRHSFTRIRGDVNGILTEEARAADLVVIGRRGRGLAERESEGTEPGPTSETLIHDALRPVLVVPSEPKSSGRVVFAYDGSKGVQRVIVPGTELAAAKQAPVTAITIGDDPEHGQKLRNVLARHWEPHGIKGKFEYLQRKGSISRIIAEYVEQQDAGLLVMGAFGHNPIRELLFGSTTLKVLSSVSCPVLLMA